MSLAVYPRRRRIGGLLATTTVALALSSTSSEAGAQGARASRISPSQVQGCAGVPSTGNAKVSISVGPSPVASQQAGIDASSPWLTIESHSKDGGARDLYAVEATDLDTRKALTGLAALGAG